MQNAFIESFNSRIRYVINLLISTSLSPRRTLREKVNTDWRNEYNNFRPHGSLRVPPALYRENLRKQQLNQEKTLSHVGNI